MKIDEMADIQDVMKCSKDKKYATQIKTKLKGIKEETASLKKKVYEINTKLNELQQESQKINRILAQAKGLIVMNDKAITVVAKGSKSVYINRAGDGLGKWDHHPFEIHKRYTPWNKDTKKRTSYVDSLRFGGKYMQSYNYQTQMECAFPDIAIVKDIGCQFVSGLLTADEAEQAIIAKCTFKKRENKKLW